MFILICGVHTGPGLIQENLGSNRMFIKRVLHLFTNRWSSSSLPASGHLSVTTLFAVWVYCWSRLRSFVDSHLWLCLFSHATLFLRRILSPLSMVSKASLSADIHVPRRPWLCYRFPRSFHESISDGNLTSVATHDFYTSTEGPS